MIEYKNYVILTDNDKPYAMTTKENWYNQISNARAIRELTDFENVEEVKNYIDKYLSNICSVK